MVRTVSVAFSKMCQVLFQGVKETHILAVSGRYGLIKGI